MKKKTSRICMPLPFLTIRFVFMLSLWLNVTHTYPHGCTIRNKDSFITADCTRLNLTEVPMDLPPNITHLNLGYNWIKNIERKFLNYRLLKKLDLKFNYINEIPNDTFNGLPFVREIIVARNNLRSLNTTPFSRLDRSLKTIDIGTNLFSSVPDLGIRDLALETLKLGSLNRRGKLQYHSLGIGFQYLTNLTELHLQDMNIGVLKNDYFKNIRSKKLKTIWLQGNKLYLFESSAFSQLTALQSLVLDGNNYFNSSMIEKSLKSLADINIKNISLQNMLAFKHLSVNTFKYLQNSSLSYLDLSLSNFVNINDNVFDHLGNLTYLRIAIAYLLSMGKSSLCGLKRLNRLDLSSNIWLRKLNSSLKHEDLSNVCHLKLANNIRLTKIDNTTFASMKSLETLDLNTCGITNISAGSFSQQHLLQYLDLSDNKNLESNGEHFFKGLKNLKKLNIAETNIEDLYGNLCSNAPKLTHLLAEHSALKKLEPSTFKGCSMLTTFQCQHCTQLGTISTAFKHVESLRYINLAHNNFDDAPEPGAFNIGPKFDTLIYFTVKENGTLTKRLPHAIRNSNMKILNIAENGITVFDKKDQDFLNTLHNLSAENNPFNCSCTHEFLQFLEWFKSSYGKRVITYYYWNGYLCAEHAKSPGQHLDLFDTAQCRKPWLPAEIALLTLGPIFIISVTLVTLAYWKRWNLRYFYLYVTVIRKSVNSPGEVEELENHIEYDAFLSYSYSDLAFVKNVLLKNLEARDSSKSEESFQWFTPSIGRLKSHYVDTLASLILHCLKIYRQAKRRVIYKHTKLLHLLYSSQTVCINRKTHPGLMKNKTKQMNSKRWPLCVLFRKNKETFKRTRKLYFGYKSRSFGACSLHFVEETMDLKKWIRRYIKGIRFFNIKQQFEKRFLFKQRVEDKDSEMLQNQHLLSDKNTFSSNSTSRGSSLHSNEHNVSVLVEADSIEQPSTTTGYSTGYSSGNNNGNSTRNSSSSYHNESMFTPILNKDDMPNYKLMVCHRDFPVGTDLAETIVEYMEKSRKSVVCVSDAFLEGKWTMFEWEISVRERNADLLLVFPTPNVNKKNMPRYMRSLMKSTLYLEWTPNDVYGQRYFLEKLKHFLGKPISVIRQENVSEKLIQAKKREIRNKERRGRDPSQWVQRELRKDAPTSRRDIWLNSAIFEPLTIQDKARILESYDNGWISKKIINAAMAVLKRQFPNIAGLQNCGRALNLAFEAEQKPFAQILNMVCDRDSELLGEINWILVTSVKCKSGNVKIYDSQNLINIPEHIKMSIANLLQAYDLNRYIMNLMTSVEQNKEEDCGVYAIANTVAILYSFDPSKLEYENSYELRKHLVYCLEKGNFEMFPTKSRNPFGWFSSEKQIRRKKSVEVHCYCKSIKDSTMVRCKKCTRFFHPCCLGQEMPGDPFRAYPGSYELSCNGCSNL